MLYEIIIQLEALNDTNDSYRWYVDQQPGLGKIFLEELALYYNKIEQNPLIFGKINKQYRHAILQRFPYIIIYEVIRRTVYVDAVFHTSRDPKEKHS